MISNQSRGAPITNALYVEGQVLKKMAVSAFICYHVHAQTALQPTNMTELFHTWLNSGIGDYLLVMLTLFILWMGAISGLRLLIETSIPNALRAIITHYFVAKHGAELAKQKLDKDNANNQ